MQEGAGRGDRRPGSLSPGQRSGLSFSGPSAIRTEDWSRALCGPEGSSAEDSGEVGLAAEQESSQLAPPGDTYWMGEWHRGLSGTVSKLPSGRPDGPRGPSPDWRADAAPAATGKRSIGQHRSSQADVAGTSHLGRQPAKGPAPPNERFDHSRGPKRLVICRFCRVLVAYGGPGCSLF